MSTTKNTSNKKEEEEANDDGGPNEGDLIIRDGFPALRVLPSTEADDDNNNDNGKKRAKKLRPMLDGDEPLPRHTFWTHEEALKFPSLESLLDDCEVVFTARDKPNGSAYSAGQTYFLPASMKPRCALESLALSIFHKHTEHCEGMYDPTTSGANWWTLVLDDVDDNDDDDDAKKKEKEGTEQHDDDEDDEEDDDNDEVGLHFDADYELEEQTKDLLLHPRVATVTYLSDSGAPTLILNQKSPPMDDVPKKTLETGIDKAWLSHPKIGKHTAFDGRLLHGAPALYFPSISRPNQTQTDDKKEAAPAEDEKDSKKLAAKTNMTDDCDEDHQHRDKRQKMSSDDLSPPKRNRNKKRYTLLVNVWLNHWVMDAALLDDDVVKQLKTPFDTDTTDDEKSSSPAFEWCVNREAFEQPVSVSNVKTVKLEPSSVDPAGEDEIALCNHNVTVYYNPTMEECHLASRAGHSADPTTTTVQLDLAQDTIKLKVGDELEEEDEEEEAEEEK